MDAIKTKNPNSLRVVRDVLSNDLEYVRENFVSMADFIEHVVETAPPNLVKRLYRIIYPKTSIKESEMTRMQIDRRDLVTKAFETVSGLRRIYDYYLYKDFFVTDAYGKLLHVPANLPFKFTILEDGTSQMKREGYYSAKLSTLDGEASFEYMPPISEEGLRMSVSWDKNTTTGERSYHVLPVLPSNADGFNEDMQNYNTLIGLMFAASFFPQAKALFPERKGLPGGNYEQYMREAQVPLLALMHRDALMDSPFFKVVEQYIGS